MVFFKKTKKVTGRNNSGKITVRHRGGGHKRKVRKIDFKINSFFTNFIPFCKQYDPNRNANLLVLKFFKQKVLFKSILFAEKSSIKK